MLWTAGGRSSCLVLLFTTGDRLRGKGKPSMLGWGAEGFLAWRQVVPLGGSRFLPETTHPILKLFRRQALGQAAVARVTTFASVILVGLPPNRRKLDL